MELKDIIMQIVQPIAEEHDLKIEFAEDDDLEAIKISHGEGEPTPKQQQGMAAIAGAMAELRAKLDFMAFCKGDIDKGLKDVPWLLSGAISAAAFTGKLPEMLLRVAMAMHVATPGKEEEAAIQQIAEDVNLLASALDGERSFSEAGRFLQKLGAAMEMAAKKPKGNA